MPYYSAPLWGIMSYYYLVRRVVSFKFLPSLATSCTLWYASTNQKLGNYYKVVSTK